MAAAKQTAGSISPGLLRVRERARRDPEARLFSLAHLIDEDALQRAYSRLRAGAAPGVDGLDKAAYGEQLSDNLRDLHQRLRSGQWRHQPLRRVHIPKEGGKTRTLGISCVEDKIVQGALREVLDCVYEPLFSECSYGFRPGRGAHDALRALNVGLRGEEHWVLEADIEGFFDSISRDALEQFIERRVADGALRRLIGKCLRVGVLDGEEYSEPDEGTPQGSILSPLLGNIYLHYVLDQWFEQEVVSRLRGQACLVRYADDFVMLFSQEQDARRVMEVLPARLERYGLTLHPDKTRLLRFDRPVGPDGKSLGTFDFLGFTQYWARSKRGLWVPRVKTRKAAIRRSLLAIEGWCRRHRHLLVKEQHAALQTRMVGHYRYYGVNGNYRSLAQWYNEVRRTWRKWLDRRSQRGRMPWWRYVELLRRFPLPQPRIYASIWATRTP